MVVYAAPVFDSPQVQRQLKTHRRRRPVMSRDTNLRKRNVLGMNHSTANSRLRKMLLWKFVVLTGADTCYRCGEKIESIDELSIDHKKSWLLSDTPIETYFDTDNIAFSHLICNSRAGSSTNSEQNLMRISTRIRSDGMVLCYECGEYLPPDKFSLRSDIAGRHVPYRSHCNKCRCTRKERGDTY